MFAHPFTAPTINAIVSAADTTSGAQIFRGSLFSTYGLNLAPLKQGQ